MIVVVVAESTEARVRAALAALAKMPNCDRFLVEIRLDHLTNPSPSVCADAPLPVMATCRRLKDGGLWQGEESERIQLLVDALSAGAAKVDVEIDVLHLWKQGGGPQLLVSHHDFHGTSADLGELARIAFESGAGEVKIATRVRDLPDLLRLRRVLLGAPFPDRMTVIGMGPGGLATRMLWRQMGSRHVYARFQLPPGEGEAAAQVVKAPGLPILHELCSEWFADSSLAKPVASFGVAGDRAYESIGPRVWNRMFRRRRIPGAYAPFVTHSVVGLREVMHEFGLRGLSITTPLKEKVVAIADFVDGRAKTIGAGNTLVLESDGLHLYNTDYDGVLKPVQDLFRPADIEGQEAIVLGAGGAGRAAALALNDLGFRTLIWSRNPARAKAAAEQVGVWPLADLELEREPPRLLVNATPAGGPRDLKGLPCPPSLVGQRTVTFEMNYGPKPTPFEGLGQTNGAGSIAGSRMYVAQAEQQVRLFWAGLPDIEAELQEDVAWVLGGQESS